MSANDSVIGHTVQLMYFAIFQKERYWNEILKQMFAQKVVLSIFGGLQAGIIGFVKVYEPQDP